MRKIVRTIMMAVILSPLVGCKRENKEKDRTGADEMFSRITTLTSNYISKLAAASDSAEWASLCHEFEDSLDKINFAYPPDTDLLLTEGQNDTIQNMLQQYIMDRDIRIHEIMHPVVSVDSILSDSLVENAVTESVNQADASRSHGN